MSQFRALSVHQPWAWAICAGLKRVENRTWTTNYRGPVAIHAAASQERLKPFLEDLPRDLAISLSLPTSAVVGVADLVDVTPLRRALEDDPSAVGPICWVFANPRLLSKPIPFKGKTSLFRLTEDASTDVTEQLALPNQAIVPAHPALRAALQMDPYERELARAEYYLYAEQDEAAFRCCKNAIQLNPANGNAYRLRGQTLDCLQRYAEAKADLDSAIAIDPNDAGAYWLRSRVHESLDNPAAARSDYARSLEIDPEVAARADAAPNDEDRAAKSDANN